MQKRVRDPNNATVTVTVRCGHKYTGKLTNGSGFLRCESSRASYEGDVEDGEFHGTGALILSSGETYTGSWWRGKRQGKGRMTFVDESYYEGDFDKDKFHGRGLYRYPGGVIFEGEFVENEKVGKGVYKKDSSDYAVERAIVTIEIKAGDMQIFIKTITDKIVVLQVQPSDTVGSIKDMVKDKERIMPNHQRLFFGGKLLEDFRSMSDYNIQNGSTIHGIPMR
jgi:hypothetical protein